MNDYGKRYLIEQMNKHDERRSATTGRYIKDNRSDNASNGWNDNAMRNGYADSASRYDNRMSNGTDNRMDNRMDGRMDSRNMQGRMDRDFHDGPMLRLNKADINNWKHHMQNTDGTVGEHYNMQQAMHAAEKLGLTFRDFDEREFCTAMNMFYSDYGHLIKRWFPNPEDEIIACAELAVAYFDDPDGIDASEKLAVQYHCLTNLG